MKTNNSLLKCLIILLVTTFTINAESQNTNKWILGYFPFYHQDDNGDALWFNNYDFDRVTHLSHHGPYINDDGTLNYRPTKVSNKKMEEAVKLCHQHNRPILLSVVSWISYMNVIKDPNKRTVLINSLLNLLDTYGYDGIDVDLEPIMSRRVDGMQTSNPNYVSFVNELYAELQKRDNAFLGRKPLLVCAANAYGAPALVQLQDKFDMINLMTYDFTNTWPDDKTWHDGAVYSNGNTYSSTGEELPSVENVVKYCLERGILPSKLGIGISFDAFQWKGGSGTPTGGVTAPLQHFTTRPSWTRFSYTEFMNNFYNQGIFHWDKAAQMSYLSLDKPNNADDQFWSYNDENSCRAKSKYVLDNNL